MVYRFRLLQWGCAIAGVVAEGCEKRNAYDVNEGGGGGDDGHLSPYINQSSPSREEVSRIS